MRAPPCAWIAANTQARTHRRTRLAAAAEREGFAGGVQALHDLGRGLVVGQRDLDVLHDKLAGLAAVVGGCAARPALRRLLYRLLLPPQAQHAIPPRLRGGAGAGAVHFEQAAVLLALGQHAPVLALPCSHSGEFSAVPSRVR